MSIIYEPKGRALEYAKLAANLYKGCAHSCKYCWVPQMTRTDREDFHKNITARDGVLRQLAKDAEKLSGDERNVLLSFTTDTYQPLDKELGLTRQAIQILNSNDIGVTILTKAGSLACRDFDLLSQYPKNEFAVTMTTDNPVEGFEWEPNVAPFYVRMLNLFVANAMGIKTWVSFEPVIDPDAVYRLIPALRDFVDLFKVGKLNYHEHAKTIDWPLFRERVMKVLEDNECEYVLKQDLINAK